MKKLYVNFLLVFSMAVISSAALADRAGGGGDMCENRIKVIRSDLSKWIQDGGPNGLLLPQEVSKAKYSTEMLKAIGSAQIKCVSTGDPGFPVQFNGTPKVCRFDQTSSASSITCDFKKFLALNETDQYVQIHHEYAGLSKVEIPNGDDSKYGVSNQISAYLVDRVVKRLAVKPRLENAGLKYEEPFRIGAFPIPDVETLYCGAKKLVTGKGSVAEGGHGFDVSASVNYGDKVQDYTLLEIDGLKVRFGSWGSDISLYVIPSNVKNDSLNYVAHSGTSLGPIRDSRDEKLFLTYKMSNGDELMAWCSYTKYE